MQRFLVLLAAALAPAAALAADQAPPAPWWNPAWASRKQVRVRLPESQPLGFFYKPPEAMGEDLLASEAVVLCEAPLAGPAQNEIRVVDAGGNVLPCVASGPDSRGLVRVVFPARRTIEAQLAGSVQDGTKAVDLTVGRDKAVVPGTRFYALAGPVPIANLEVVSVGDKTCTARVIDKTVPSVAKGIPVRSAVLPDAVYYIYYGNPKPEGPGPAWTPPSAAVTQFGWRITSGSVPTTVGMLGDVLRASPQSVGTTKHQQMACTTNPLGYTEDLWYISAYEGLIQCELPGLYRFAIDSGGPAYVFVDGRFAAQRPGFFHQTGQFEHRGKIQLDAGSHQLLLLATENAAKRVTRLAWQPITGTVFDLMPESAFTTRVGAETEGYETRDGGPQVFFTTSLAPRSLVAGGKDRFQFVQFHNRSPRPGPDSQDRLEWTWELGDADRSRQVEPGHLYALTKDGAPAFGVSLRATRGNKIIGEYARQVYCDPRPAQKFMISSEIMSFANIVYDDEATSIAVRLRNPAFSAVVLRAVGRLAHGGDTEILVNRDILIRGENESFCVLPMDMKALGADKRATIGLDLLLGGQKVASVGARVIPSPEELDSLKPGLGALYDAEGRRVMICADLEDPDRHMRWVFARYLRDEVYARYAETRNRTFLFGDRMTNPVGPDQSFTDYVGLLQTRIEKQGRAFGFAPRGAGLLPTVPDLVRFAAALKAADPQPDIVVISPGLADVAQATGDRNFARAVDVMIDCVRAVSERIKIVIVSPPPYPGNRRLSLHYTRVLQKVAREHYIPFVDLDKLLTDGHADWLKAYYATPDAEGIYYENPNEAGQRRIADAILEMLY